MNTQPINLSSLIASQINGAATIELCIKPDETLTISDDMGMLLTQPMIITLAANSTLAYELREVDNTSSAKKLTRTITVRLAGAGSRADMRMIVAGQSTDAVAFKTLQHHIAPHTSSELVIKSVLFDHAQLRSDNLIRIEPEAQHTNACEVNKNLILGDHAKVISIPKIEVEADEVRCEHGAAMSRLSELDLFYVQSRGIAREDAKAMLIDAFLQ